MPDAQIPSVAAERQQIWLRVGTLIDGISAAPVRGAHVVYDASGFLHVGGPDRPPPPELLGPSRDHPALDLPEHTLLPGLTEAHAHLFLDGGELDPARRSAARADGSDALLQAARDRLDRIVREGIVAVRDAGDKFGVGLALSRLARSPDRPLMPLVESPGAAIHHRGRYGGFMSEPVEAHASPRDCVQARVLEGADRIKLIATGIVDFAAGDVTAPPQMTAEEVGAFVSAAREFGKRTFAHASGAEGIRRVIDGGIDSVEHGLLMAPDDLSRLRDREIAWTPTFAPVARQLDHADRLGWDERAVSNLREILDRHAEQLRRAHALGVPITAGSDAGSYGVPHGEGLLDELELMEAAGLPPAAVLATAIGDATAHLGFRERCGRIAPGYPARFILTRRSPLERVANLKEEKTVVFDGIAYEG